MIVKTSLYCRKRGRRFYAEVQLGKALLSLLKREGGEGFRHALEEKTSPLRWEKETELREREKEANRLPPLAGRNDTGKRKRRKTGLTGKRGKRRELSEYARSLQWHSGGKKKGRKRRGKKDVR